MGLTTLNMLYRTYYSSTTRVCSGRIRSEDTSTWKPRVLLHTGHLMCSDHLYCLAIVIFLTDSISHAHIDAMYHSNGNRCCTSSYS